MLYARCYLFVLSSMALNLVVTMASPDPLTTATLLLGPSVVYIIALVRPDACSTAGCRG